MINSFRNALLLVAVTAISLISCAPKKTVELKLKLAKGETYRYGFDFDIDQEVMNQKMKTTMNMGFAMKITDDDGTYKTMQATYDRIAMSMHTPQMNVDVDTDKPLPAAEDGKIDPTRIMGVMFQAMKGQSFTMKVSEKGDVKEISGLEAMIDNMLASITRTVNLPEDQLASIKQNARGQFNEASLKDLMQQSFNIYPDKPVAVGDTWTKDVETKGGLGIKLNNVYTLKSVEGDKATIDVKAKVNANINGTTLAGIQTTAMVIDTNNGMMLSAAINQDLSGKVAGTDMKMTSKGTITGKK